MPDQTPLPSSPPIQTNPITRVTNTDKLLSHIFRFTDNNTLITSLRVNKTFFESAGKFIYRSVSVIRNPGVLLGIEIPPLKAGSKSKTRNWKVKLFSKIKVLEVPLGKPVSQDEVIRKAFWAKIPKLDTLRFTYTPNCICYGQTSTKSKLPKSLPDTKWPKKVVFTNMVGLDDDWLEHAQKFVEHAEEVTFAIAPTFLALDDWVGGGILEATNNCRLVRVMFCSFPQKSFCGKGCTCTLGPLCSPFTFETFIRELAHRTSGRTEFCFLGDESLHGSNFKEQKSYLDLSVTFDRLTKKLITDKEEVSESDSKIIPKKNQESEKAEDTQEDSGDESVDSNDSAYHVKIEIDIDAGTRIEHPPRKRRKDKRPLGDIGFFLRREYLELGIEDEVDQEILEWWECAEDGEQDKFDQMMEEFYPGDLTDVIELCKKRQVPRIRPFGWALQNILEKPTSLAAV